MKVTKISFNSIDRFAKLSAKNLKGGEIFALIGDLGAGKTTLVKKFGKVLNIRHKITSPTFILLQAFEFRLPASKGAGKDGQVKLKTKKFLLYHLDLYRTKNFGEVKALGLTEFWGKPNTVTFIEWADKIKNHLPAKTQIIQFKQ